MALWLLTYSNHNKISKRDSVNNLNTVEKKSAYKSVYNKNHIQKIVITSSNIQFKT